MDIHSFWFQIRSKLNLSKALKIRLLTVNRVFLTYYSAHTIWIYERWKLRTVCSWVTVVCPSLAFTRWNDNRIQNGCLTFSGIVTRTWLIRSAMFEYWSNTFNMLSAFYPPPSKKKSTQQTHGDEINCQISHAGFPRWFFFLRQLFLFFPILINDVDSAWLPFALDLDNSYIYPDYIYYYFFFLHSCQNDVFSDMIYSIYHLSVRLVFR